MAEDAHIEGLRRRLRALDAERARLLAGVARALPQTHSLIDELATRPPASGDTDPGQARLRDDPTPVVVFHQDLDLVYTWIYNPHHGLTPRGVTGKRDRDLLETESAHRLEAIKRRVLDTGVGVRIEVETRLRDAGEPRWYDLTIDPLSDVTGTIKEIAGVAVDITERKQAEQMAVQARDFAESVIDTVHEPLIVLDDDLRVVSANHSFYQTFLVRPEATEGSLLHMLGIRQWDIPGLRDLLARILPHDETVEAFEVEHDFPTIGRRTMLLNARRIHDQAGEAHRILLAIEDVTERRRAEQALFEEKELAQVTLRSIGDAAITTDRVGRVEYLNPVAERLTGWTVQEAQGRPLEDIFQIFNEHTRQPVVNPVARCLSEGGVIGLANDTVLVSRNGTEYLIADTAAPIRSRSDEILGVVLIFQDVTDARNLARQVAHQATHDALTELVNRREFERRLDHALHSARERGSRHALAYLDLDQFKVVNDTCGHVAGDQLLQRLTDLLRGLVRSRDTLARLGGDEFGLLLEHCDLDDAQRIVAAMLERVGEFRFTWEEHSFSPGLSGGLIAVSPSANGTATLLAEADAACYMAKHQGRNRLHVRGPDDAELGQRHGGLDSTAEIRAMLETGRLELFGQPIRPLAGDLGGAPAAHYEVLLRFDDPAGGLILPSAFIAAAERCNLMSAIDRWVIRATFEHCARRQAHRPQSSPVWMSVNISGSSLDDGSLLNYINQQLRTHDIPPGMICFEITETAAIAKLGHVLDLMTALKAVGCRLALDDFGAGPSSLRHLKLLPVDYLKLDGAFVKNIADDPVDQTFVDAVQRIARTLGIRTVAEWVESDAMVDQLRALGVDYGQGFALGRPAPLDEIWPPPSSSPS